MLPRRPRFSLYGSETCFWKESRQRTFISRTALLARNSGGIRSRAARAFSFMNPEACFWKESRQRTFTSRTALLARNPGGICSLAARAFLFMDQKPAFEKKAGKELLCRGALVPSLCMAKTASPASAFSGLSILESSFWKESKQELFLRAPRF